MLLFFSTACNELQSKELYLLLKDRQQKIFAYELIKISHFLASQPNTKQIRTFQLEITYLKQYLKKFNYYYESYCRVTKRSNSLSLKLTGPEPGFALPA